MRNKRPMKLFWFLFIFKADALFNVESTYNECKSSSIDDISEQMVSSIRQLCELLYFRYVKVDLYQACPFWNETPMCSSPKCSVTVDDEDIKEISIFGKKKNISNVEFSLKDKGFAFLRDMEDKRDFCVNENDEINGSYVNLLKNPERFTGYEGEHANKMWAAIYDENCFKRPGSISKEQCLERHAFYKVISGMHASISTHIASNYFDTFTNSWVRNPTIFWDRVGNYPERIENLKFAYSILLRAVVKASTFLQNHRFEIGDAKEEKLASKLVKSVIDISSRCQVGIENRLFMNSGNKKIKQELKTYFRNVSKIMNCLSCEKCRLWGKIQTQGIGTALKILYSFSDAESIDLTRTEIVCLFNVLDRFSNSLSQISSFQHEKNDQQHNQQHSQMHNQQHSQNNVQNNSQNNVQNNVQNNDLMTIESILFHIVKQYIAPLVIIISSIFFVVYSLK